MPHPQVVRGTRSRRERVARAAASMVREAVCASIRSSPRGGVAGVHKFPLIKDIISCDPVLGMFKMDVRSGTGWDGALIPQLPGQRVEILRTASLLAALPWLPNAHFVFALRRGEVSSTSWSSLPSAEPIDGLTLAYPASPAHRASPGLRCWQRRRVTFWRVAGAGVAARQICTGVVFELPLALTPLSCSHCAEAASCRLVHEMLHRWAACCQASGQCAFVQLNELLGARPFAD